MKSIYFSLDVWFVVAALAFTGMFSMTILYGRALFKNNTNRMLKEVHRWHANCALVSLALAVLFIEIKVRLGGFADRAPELFWGHLCFSIPFLLSLLLLRFKITGKKNLLLHKKIAYASIALFLGTAVTGAKLFFNF